MFLPSIALIAVAMLFGTLVRSRHAYAAQVRHRWRLADQEQQRDAKARVPGSGCALPGSCTIRWRTRLSPPPVQSGAALHLIDREPGRVREPLAAIRQTGRSGQRRYAG